MIKPLVLIYVLWLCDEQNGSGWLGGDACAVARYLPRGLSGCAMLSVSSWYLPPCMLQLTVLVLVIIVVVVVGVVIVVV